MSDENTEKRPTQEDMTEALESFKEGVVGGAESFSFPVPPDFLGDALKELTEDYDGPRRFEALTVARANEYIDLLHENGNRIRCLLEEQEDRKNELQRLEKRNERENEQAEKQLRMEIRSRFSEADQIEQDRLFGYILGIGVTLHPESILHEITPPRLHGEIEDPGHWQALRRQLNPHKGQIQRLRFDLEVLRMVITHRRANGTIRKYKSPQAESSGEDESKADEYARRVYSYLEDLDSIRQFSLHALATEEDGTFSDTMYERQSKKEGGWRAPYRVWKDHGYWQTGPDETLPRRLEEFKSKVRQLVEEGEYPAKPEG